MTKVPNVKGVLWNFHEPSHSAKFFSFFFPEGEIFQDSALFVTDPSLKRSRVNTAKSRQTQVSWGHAMSYLMRGNPKNNSYLHNYALIVSGDFYQISVFSLSTKTQSESCILPVWSKK